MDSKEPDVSVSIDDNKITFKKARLIYETSFTELFAIGAVEHEFKEDAKVKLTLIKHQKTLDVNVYEVEDVTYLKYHSEYFEIVIKIPNHLFEIDLENCSEREQLKYYKDKYEEHIRILTLNNYRIDTIKINRLQGGDFLFSFYQPDEIIYDHKGFIPPVAPKQHGQYGQYGRVAPKQYGQKQHQMTKEEYRLVMLQTFYNSIMEKYGVVSNKFNNYELEIASFLSENKINITDNKYYKKINQQIYYIKDNQMPNVIFDIYNDKISISNLDLLYLSLDWMVCPKDLTSYFRDFIDELTVDHIVTELPMKHYFVDSLYESDIFIINVSGNTKGFTHNYNGGRRESQATTMTFAVSLLYKFVIKNNVLSSEYVGAMQYYHSTFKKYAKQENIPIVFDAMGKAPKIGQIEKYQTLLARSLSIREVTACTYYVANSSRHHNQPQQYQPYSLSVTSNFPVTDVTLKKINKVNN